MYWLISANSKIYDHASSFAHYKSIDWHQGNIKYNIGDIIYIYCSRPYKRIRYKCIVSKINLDFHDTRDDYKYWINKEQYDKSVGHKFFNMELLDEIDTDKLDLYHLKDNGLKQAPQTPMRLKGDLLAYIEENFNINHESTVFPDTLDRSTEIFEGVKRQVIVNKYERSSLARSMCIEEKGVRCYVCDMSFEDVYGDIGKGFIHIHHLKPIHTIDKEYKIDFKKDLIPVCPNCHAMLHRGEAGETLRPEELKEIIEKYRN